MPNSGGLKDSKILVILGKKQAFTDVLRALTSHFSQVLSTSKMDGVKVSSFDLIVVDYSVSDMTGILLYKELAQSAKRCLAPAIFVANTKSYDHRLNAFEIGAADFVSRPFDGKNLIKKCVLHIKNRRRVAEDDSIHIGNLSLYPGSDTVIVGGKSVVLTHFEHKILYFLLSTPRPVVSRSEIYQNVWGADLSSSGRLDTQLYNLKKKLVNFNGKIKSVNKVGMRILIAESTFSQEQKTGGPQSRPQESRP